MNTREWAETFQKEVFNRWKKDVPHGWPEFKVFYNPIQDNPTIVIVGTNPGSKSNKNDVSSVPEELPSRDLIQRMEENNDFSLPDRHQLTTEPWSLAKILRENLFLGDTELIESSVTMINRHFLHSSETKDIAESEYESFNEFCEDKSWEIVSTLDPDLVICLSKPVYEDFISRSDISTTNKKQRHIETPVDYLLYERADGPKQTIMRIVHPSSKNTKKFQGEIEESEWEELRNQIGEFVTIQ